MVINHLTGMILQVIYNCQFQDSNLSIPPSPPDEAEGPPQEIAPTLRISDWSLRKVEGFGCVFRVGFFWISKNMDVSKNRGKTPKMDGENNRNPIKIDDLGVFPYFWKPPVLRSHDS